MSQEPEPLPANEAIKPITRYAWVTVTTTSTHAYLCECPADMTDAELYDGFTAAIPPEMDAHIVEEDRCEVEVDGRTPSDAEIRMHAETAVSFLSLDHDHDHDHDEERP